MPDHSDETVESDLREMESQVRSKTVLSGKYFVRIPPGRPGTREGIGFRLLMLGMIPTDVLTLAERVTIIIEEDREVPWASVELLSGLFHTELKISSKDLAKATCLAKAKRA